MLYSIIIVPNFWGCKFHSNGGYLLDLDKCSLNLKFWNLST